MAYGEVSRGLADVKIHVLTGAGDTPGTAIDIPGARSLEFQAEQDSEEWEGDDGVLAVSQDNKLGTGTLSVGRQNPTAIAALLGGTAIVSGVTPSLITTHNETDLPNDVYVMVRGQARSLDTAGSGYRVTLGKAKFSSPAETMANKEFSEPTMDMAFYKSAAGIFIRREWFETRVDIPSTFV